MWASRARYQASVKGKISSLHWLEASSVDGTEDSAGAGWIAAGGTRSDLSISWFSRAREEKERGSSNACPTQSGSTIYKSHFNLRGHSVGIKFVRWKPQGDKLVSFDSWGNLIVWKNRSNIFASDFTFTVVTPITDIQWSPCGMYIALCGDEGQLQVVSGNDGSTVFAIHAVSTSLYGRYAEFNCLSWNVDSTRIVLGTSRGEVIEVDPNQNGRFLSMMTMHENTPVCKVDYFGRVEYFKVQPERNQERGVDNIAGDDDGWLACQGLSVYMEDGEVAIFNAFTETRCNCVQTRIYNGVVSWNTAQTLLAVVGHKIRDSSSTLMLRLVNPDAHIVMTIEPLITLPHADMETMQHQYRLSSICWGLNDSMIFIAQGSNLLSVDIVKDDIPSLKYLCRELITSDNSTPHELERLPLPNKEINILESMTLSLIPLLFKINISPLTSPTSKPLPHHVIYRNLYHPLPNNQRTHCIIVSTTRNTHGPSHHYLDTVYTLMYEHFGSYVPLLRATRKSKILKHVEFEIKPVEYLVKDDDHTYWGTTPGSRRSADGSAMPTFPNWGGATPSTSSSSSSSRRRSNSLTDNTRLTRIRKAFQQKLRRPSSVVVEGVSPSTSEVAVHPLPRQPIIPTIAEVSGTKFTNRFRITSTDNDYQGSDGSGLLGIVNIYSHHITCEPRDVTITVYNGSPSSTQLQEGEEHTMPSVSGETVLFSKKPEWNSRFKMYELDFGGRISKDSVKNFQVEENGEIVLQFGRSNFTDFCVDFQNPFSPVTAFGVAISSIHSC